MANKPTYEELEQRVKELEQEVINNKKLEERLKLFLLVFEQDTNAIIILDPEGNVEYANPKMLDAYKMHPDEAIGKNWRSFLSMNATIREHIPEIRNTVIENGKMWKGEVSDIDNEGKNIWREVRLFPIKDEKGEIIHAVYISEDITERKRAENALRVSEEQLRSLMEETTDAIFCYEYDPPIPTDLPIAQQVKKLYDGVLAKCNDVCARSYGAKHTGEVIGRKLTDLFGTIPDSLDDLFTAMIKGGYRIIDGEGVEVLEDGTKRYYLNNGHGIIEGGQLIRVWGTFRDITDRKLAESAQRETEERYRLFVENANIGICIVQDGKVKSPNPYMLEISGYSTEELVETPFTDFIHIEDRDMVASNYIRRLRGEDIPNLYVFRTMTKTGDVLWVQMSAVPLTWQESPAVLTFLSDITDKRRLEIQLQQAQKMEAIGTLAGGIAHDFNNILGIIIGYAEMMEMFDVPEDSSMRFRLKEVLNGAYRARDLVQQILTFSRQAEQNRKPVQPSLIIKEAIKFLRSSLPTTIEIHQRIESEEGIIMADPIQIHQILMNLCTNAAHAMREEGGVLNVGLSEVDLDEQATESYVELNPGSYIKLTVRDTGHGMTPEVMERIFDPYFTTKEKGEGTGLGLATVHGIVKSYGGVVTVESEFRKGSTFQVFIPMLEREIDEEKAEISPPIPTGNECILFVDDEKTLVDTGKGILEHLGYEVITRTSGIEALEAFRAHPDRFDLVITDMTMPNMTGVELTKEIMKMQPDIPIILCTGYSEMISEDRAKVIGMKEFLLKPLGVRNLAATVRKALDDNG
jgi:PAS domain S-box-containing protein